VQPKNKFVQLLMPNKDFRKYNKGDSSLPMKAKGKTPLFFIFLLRREILEEVKKNLYIFGGGGNFEKIL
jgi:hypothetical protein